MKNALLVFLLLLAIIMMVIGAKLSILPPVLTGVGFIIIALLFYQQKH